MSHKMHFPSDITFIQAVGRLK